MAQIIAVSNLKGGVSKSVLSVNLACALRDVGKVVIADTDNQQSAVWWSRKAQAGVEVLAARQDGDKRAWAQRLAGVDAALIIIDCGSNDPDGLGASFAVSSFAVIPCPPNGVDIKATRDTLDVLKIIRGSGMELRQHCSCHPALTGDDRAGGRSRLLCTISASRSVRQSWSGRPSRMHSPPEHGLAILLRVAPDIPKLRR